MSYTEQERVKQKYPQAQCLNSARTMGGEDGYLVVDADDSELGWSLDSEQEAWADASRRMGNEFVDEIGPLPEKAL